MASSCSFASEIKYDIFLNFRGTDTRRGFLSHLVKALNHKQIETFVDYKLKEGTEISPSLLRAIEESQISLIIFSQDYASSKWCLDELVKIIKCMKENGQIAIPIFYDVDPCWVRNQTGSYHDALAEHEKTSSGDKVQNWRKALKEAAMLSGLHSSNFGNDAELIDEIVKRVLQRLNQMCQGDFQGLVGIYEPIAQIESLLCRESRAVLVIGLWGMGGIGKTTLASAVFNRLCHEFQGFCFLDNVREGVQKYGINHLKKELLSKLLNEEDADSFIMPSGITNLARRTLRRKNVLVLLDDVGDSDQLEDLCGGHDWFGPNSRIMVTTRDKLVLNKADHIHTVKALNSDESLQLFRLNAFKQNYIDTEQLELSMRVVNYAKGIPLALKVLGSLLYGKSKEEWESELAKLEKVPHVKIQNILRLSYNELDHNDRNVFLYLACFFETATEEQIKFLLDSCGYSTASGLRNLQDKALVSISESWVTMHDLIREMGREVVREESRDDPGKRSRLWDPTDIYGVLKYNRGTEAIESITLDMSEIDVLSLHPQTFARMYKLKFLDIHSWDGKHRLCAPEGIESLSDELRIFHWDDYPSESLPLFFCAENLVEIIMPFSRLEKLWEGVQNLVNLNIVDLAWSLKLIELPDLSKALNLEELNISNCKSLRQVPPSIGSSHKLVYVFLHDCNELCSFQHNVHQKSLKTLSFHNCTSLIELSLTCENPSSLTQLDTDTLILPTPLERLKLDYCSNLSLLPDNINTLSSLKDLSLFHSNVRSLPESIKHLSQLKYLNLRNCERLQSLPELPSSIVRLIVVNCTSLRTVLFSNSMAELTKEEQSRYETFAFANCTKLQEPAINTIIANACLRIKRAAHNTCLKTIQENEDGRAFNRHYDHRVCVCLPGSQVPGWFSYRTTHSCKPFELVLRGSITNRFLGFILCAVLPPNKNVLNPESLGCEYRIEASDGRSVKYGSLWFLMNWELAQEGNNVYLWYDGQCSLHIMREMKESKANDEGKTMLKVSFDFYVSMSKGDPRYIKECGVHPIYESDVLNLGKQWQMESGLGIKSKRRAEMGNNVAPSVESCPLRASSFTQRLASLCSTDKKRKKSKAKYSLP